MDGGRKEGYSHGLAEGYEKGHADGKRIGMTAMAMSEQGRPIRSYDEIYLGPGELPRACRACKIGRLIHSPSGCRCANCGREEVDNEDTVDYLKPSEFKG